MASYRDILRTEFSADEGSFLLVLHVWNIWDDEAFTRVTTAMWECCEDQEHQETVEHWLANGFWDMYGEVTGYLANPAARRVNSPEYYAKAVSSVFDLACWYFSGERPFLRGTTQEMS